jgi:hypothetical protein
MPESIVIRDIHLPEMDPDQMTRIMPQSRAQSRVRWYDLTVTVKNVSDVVPLYVISGVRWVRYDASRRVLFVQFSEHDVPTARRVVGLPSPPPYTVIDPGEEATLTFRLSSPLPFLEESPEGERRPYFVRVPEDVDTIECAVAYGTDPPAPAGDLTSRVVRTHWGDWGTTVQASWEPSREGREESSD